MGKVETLFRETAVEKFTQEILREKDATGSHSIGINRVKVHVLSKRMELQEN